MNITHGSIALGTGPTLRYAEHGDRDGIPVILLHGYADSWRSYERVLPHLPPAIRAVALSQRGHGDADKPASGYRPRDFAADLRAFMDQLAIPRAVIVGHSMGGAIAQRFAIDHPRRTLGLVLVGAFKRFGDNAAVRDLWDGAVATLADPVDPGFVEEFQRSTLAQALPHDYYSALVRESLKVPAHVWRAALAGLIDDDAADELGSIAAPTAIVWGERDGFAPRADQDALAAAISNAKLTIYPAIGHAPHWEEPVRFALDLTAFIARRVAPSIAPIFLRPAA